MMRTISRLLVHDDDAGYMRPAHFPHLRQEYITAKAGRLQSDEYRSPAAFCAVCVILCAGVLQRGLAPRIFEYLFLRIAEEEDEQVCLCVSCIAWAWGDWQGKKWGQ